MGMESGIIYVLNIGLKHIDTSLKAWIGRDDWLGLLEVKGNSAKIHQFQKKISQNFDHCANLEHHTKCHETSEYHFYTYNKAFRLIFIVGPAKINVVHKNFLIQSLAY